MAEENIDIPEIMEPKGDHTRRNSTGKIETPNGGRSILSRYLRSSIGSCHDICKFGSIHTFESKAKNDMPKKITTALIPGEGLLEKMVNLSQRKKKSVITLERASDSKTGRPNNPLVIKREVSSTTKKITFSAAETNVSVECGCDPKLKPLKSKSSSLPTKEPLSSSRNIEIRKSTKTVALSINPLRGSSSRRNGKITVSKEMRTSILIKKKGVVPRTVSMSPNSSVKRVSSPNAGKYKNRKGVLHQENHLKNQSNVKEAEPCQSSSEDVPEKILHVIEPNAENKHVAPTQNGVNIDLSPSSAEKTLPSSYSSSADRTLRHTRNGIRTTRLPPSSEKKNLRRTRVEIHATRSPPSLSSSSETKSLRRARNGAQSTRMPLSSSSSSSSSLCTSPPKSTKSAKSSTTSEHDESGTNSQIVNSKVKHKSRPRKGGVISSEDKDCPPRKQNFRRGKVVDLQPENISPRKLTFRRGRVLGENQNGKDDTGKKSFEKKVDDGKLNFTTAKIKPENVVLRRQNGEAKKKAQQQLFNNVIEETASKLVKTRKSKVKALVGAFETVISLQVTKPSVTISTC